MDTNNQPNQTPVTDTVINNGAPQKHSMLLAIIILLVIAVVMVLIMSSSRVPAPEASLTTTEDSIPAEEGTEPVASSEESADIRSDLEMMEIDGISEGI